MLEGAQSLALNAPSRVTGRDGAQTDFILSIPNRIVREFRGTLEVRREGGHLLALVAMDLETATPEAIAAALAAGLDSEVQPAAVERDGAANAARLIASLL